MNSRLLILRKSLKLTQENFAEKLNITNAHVSALEKGRRPLTDRIIYDICREFNVNEEWLRTGNGEMFRTFITDNNLAGEIAKLLSSDDEWTKNAVLQFLKLSSEQREIIKSFLSAISPK